MTKSLKKATAVLLTSEYLSKGFLIVIGLLIVRFLGAQDFGRFAAAYALAQILAILVDAGMGQLAAKNVADASDMTEKKVGQIFSWRLSLMTLACLFTPLIGMALFDSIATRVVSNFMVPAILLFGLVEFFVWVLKGKQRVKLAGVISVGSRMLLFVLCALSIFFEKGLSGIVGSYVIAGVISAFTAFICVSGLLSLVRPVKLTSVFFSNIAPEIYKFGGILACSVIFTQVDLMLVARILGETEAGLYGCSHKVLQALSLIPMAVYGAYMPFFSSHRDNNEELRAKFTQAVTGLLLVAGILCVIGTIFSKSIFTIVFGAEYAVSAKYFIPLLWSTMFAFTNRIILALLFVKEDYKTLAISIGLALVLNVSLNVMLLPVYGVMVAAWSKLAADGLNFSIKFRGLLKQRILKVGVMS